MTVETIMNKGSQKTRGTANPVRQRLYDLKASAQYLGRPVWGVRELIWAGKLPYIQEGRKQYIDIVDLDQYIERNKQIMD